MTLVAISEADYVEIPEERVEETIPEDPEKLGELISKLEADMREAAKRFEFERAAQLRDKARALRAKLINA
jgi:excinuclease ABC subunit B